MLKYLLVWVFLTRPSFDAHINVNIISGPHVTCASHLGPCFLTPRRAFSQLELRSWCRFLLAARPLLQDLKSSQSGSGLIFRTLWRSAFHASATPPATRKACTWVSPNPQLDRHNKTPRKHRTRQAARFLVGFWILRFWANTVAWVLQIEIGTLSPSRRFVSPFGTGRVCHLQLLARVMPARFQQLGGEVLLFPWEPFGNVNWLGFLVAKC